ncbi:hypothetical protein LB505_006972 [Fusarium chuoi]|nr:hypothetical protein LB505_006972 [Fusarium chuoi]
MRPPRVFVLILFIAASLLLFCRAISSSLRTAYADYPAGNFRSRQKTDSKSSQSRSHNDDSENPSGIPCTTTPHSHYFHQMLPSA